MVIKNKLIVSPSNLKFQAPFPHNQKRQLSLLNPSNRDIVYSTKVDNEALFQVIPSSGKLAKYSTIELNILMKPASSSLLVSLLKVKYKEASEESNLEDPLEISAGDWTEAHTAQVKIVLENSMANEEEMRRLLALEETAQNLSRIIEKQYQPVCTNCCLKQTNPRVLAVKASWPRLLFWPGSAIVALSLTGN